MGKEAHTAKPARGPAFGILNAQGQFWTYSTFQSEGQARTYMADFNRSFNPPLDLSRRRIVPVRVTVGLDRAAIQRATPEGMRKPLEDMETGR